MSLPKLNYVDDSDSTCSLNRLSPQVRNPVLLASIRKWFHALDILLNGSNCAFLLKANFIKQPIGFKSEGDANWFLLLMSVYNKYQQYLSL